MTGFQQVLKFGDWFAGLDGALWSVFNEPGAVRKLPTDRSRVTLWTSWTAAPGLNYSVASSVPGVVYVLLKLLLIKNSLLQSCFTMGLFDWWGVIRYFTWPNQWRRYFGQKTIVVSPEDFERWQVVIDRCLLVRAAGNTVFYCVINVIDQYAQSKYIDLVPECCDLSVL